MDLNPNLNEEEVVEEIAGTACEPEAPARSAVPSFTISFLPLADSITV